MYCRKCLKTSHGEKKVNMHGEIEEHRYKCPECGHIVDWNKKGINSPSLARNF